MKDQDDFEYSSNLTKFNTHANVSMAMSYPETNSITCPHSRGSMKSNFETK